MLILELKDKIGKELSTSDDTLDGALDTVSSGNNFAEATNALMVLGYSRQEAQAALKGVDPLLSLEDMITAALRKMMPKF